MIVEKSSFPKETDWKSAGYLISLPVKSNMFFLCVCFHADHLVLVTDSGESQHRIRLNYKEEEAGVGWWGGGGNGSTGSAA